MEKSNTRVGLNFGEALLVAFIVLKLTGVISWSWLWVLSPLWISLGVVVVLVIIWIVLKVAIR